MIEFYPRDIELWRGVFDFGITLLYNPDKPKMKQFYNRNELIEFLKEHGVRLDDPKHPLEFLGPREHPVLGSAYDVVQWTLLGWTKEL